MVEYCFDVQAARNHGSMNPLIITEIICSNLRLGC